MTLDGVALGSASGLEHAGGARGRAVGDRDDGDFHGVESPHDRRVILGLQDSCGRVSEMGFYGTLALPPRRPRLAFAAA